MKGRIVIKLSGRAFGAAGDVAGYAASIARIARARQPFVVAGGGEGEAMEVYRKAREAGIPEYAGGQVSIWNDAYPTVQGGGPAGGGEA